MPELDEHGDVTVRQVVGEDEYPTRLGEARIINLTPWFHAMGAIGYLNGMVMGGTTDGHPHALRPGEVRRGRRRGTGHLHRRRARRSSWRCCRCPASPRPTGPRVRGVSSGAAPLPVTLIERLKALLPNAVIGEGYGLTEVTMQATGNPVVPVRHPQARHRRRPGVRHRDQHPAARRRRRRCPPGERGEVCIRGPQVMRGYAHRPEATAESIDADGWFHTGDVGILDEDGYLSIVDRTKDMLLYKGYNVFPRELEEILFGVPGVAGAAVVGRPDEEAGELPVAYVVRKADDAGRGADRASR